MKKQLYILLGLIISFFVVSGVFGMDADRPMQLLPWEAPAEKTLMQPEISNNTWNLTSQSNAVAQIRDVKRNGSSSSLIKRLHIANENAGLYPSKIFSKSIDVLAKNNAPIESIVAMKVQSPTTEKEQRKFGKSFIKLGLFPALKELTLTDSPMNELNENISFAQSLQKLQGTNLGLVRIPGTIGLLKQLRELNLRSNRLTQLPAQIGELKLLEKLNLYDNQITQLPSTITSLVKLQTLDIGKNNLKMIPRLKKLLKLPNLNTISAKDNNITTLQPELNAAVHPMTLELEGNPIASPAQVGNVTVQMRKKNPEQIPGDSILVTIQVKPDQYTQWEKIERDNYFEKQYESANANGKEIALKIPDSLYGIFRDELKAHNFKYEKTGSQQTSVVRAPSSNVASTQSIEMELSQLLSLPTTNVNNNNVQQTSTTTTTVSPSLTQKRRLIEDAQQAKKNKIDDNNNNNNLSVGKSISGENRIPACPPAQPLPAILPPPPNPSAAVMQIPASGVGSVHSAAMLVLTNTALPWDQRIKNYLIEKYRNKPTEISATLKQVNTDTRNKLTSKYNKLNKTPSPEQLKEFLKDVTENTDYKSDPLAALGILKTFWSFTQAPSELKKEIMGEIQRNYNQINELGIKLPIKTDQDVRNLIETLSSSMLSALTPLPTLVVPAVSTQRVLPVPTPVLPVKAVMTIPSKQSVPTPRLLPIKQEESVEPRTPAWSALSQQLQNTDNLPMAVPATPISNNNEVLPSPYKTTVSMPAKTPAAKVAVKMPMNIPSAQSMQRPSSIVSETVHANMLKLAKQFNGIDIKEFNGVSEFKIVVEGEQNKLHLFNELQGKQYQFQSRPGWQAAEYKIFASNLVHFINAVESKGLKIIYAPPQLDK